MLGFNGGLIGVRRTPTVDAAPGLWFQNEQSVAKRAEIWPLGLIPDPDFASVSLLLHMDGTNGSTTFTDSSSNTLSVTANGNAQISTTQSKFGGASGSFDGSGDYLDISGSSLLAFPGEFSVQGWARSARGTTETVFELGDYTNGILLRAFANSNDNIYVNGQLGNVNLNSFISTNTWFYFSITRNSSNLVQVAIDGTVRGSATVSGTINSTNAALRIAEARNTSGQALNGYVDDFRITKGVARSHTPPTAPFPDA
jgi:hypothetical protein